MDATRSDRLNLRLMLVLAILGAVLAAIGWYRYFGGA